MHSMIFAINYLLNLSATRLNCMVGQHIVTLKIVRVGCIILSPQSHSAKPLCKTHRCVTVATTLYSGYHYLYRLQQVQLVTLSTAGKTTYTVYNRFNQLHCLQLVNHIVHPWSLVALQLNFAQHSISILYDYFSLSQCSSRAHRVRIMSSFILLFII